jgi:hypothetical protein
MKIAVILDTRTANRDEKHPVKFRFTEGSKKAAIEPVHGIIYYPRPVYNQAINEDIVSLSLYPFRKFKIKKEATLKRSITVDALHKIFDYEGNDLENRSQDAAKLIFF